MRVAYIECTLACTIIASTWMHAWLPCAAAQHALTPCVTIGMSSCLKLCLCAEAHGLDLDEISVPLQDTLTESEVHTVTDIEAENRVRARVHTPSTKSYTTFLVWHLLSSLAALCMHGRSYCMPDKHARTRHVRVAYLCTQGTRQSKAASHGPKAKHATETSSNSWHIAARADSVSSGSTCTSYHTGKSSQSETKALSGDKEGEDMAPAAVACGATSMSGSETSTGEESVDSPVSWGSGMLEGTCFNADMHTCS